MDRRNIFVDSLLRFLRLAPSDANVAPIRNPRL